MRGRAQRGYTLIELLVVIAIITLIAAIATPALTNTDEGRLEQAAADVASAVRFAHSEAIRTGEPYGIHAEQSAQRIRVYHLDTSVNPFVVEYNNYDPLTKQLYDLRFNTSATDVALSSFYFKFQGSFSPQQYLGFSGGTGLPKFNDGGTVRMLESGYVDLSHEGVTRRIRISPMTARVTVQ